MFMIIIGQLYAMRKMYPHGDIDLYDFILVLSILYTPLGSVIKQ